jgi:hypothetical protein
MTVSIKLLALFSFITFSACSYVQKQIDISSEKDLANNIVENFESGNPDSLKNHLSKFSLEKETKPNLNTSFKIQGKPRWSLTSPKGTTLIQERISFPSELPNDTAFFYIFRKGDFKNRNVIIWVPGFRVSDLAFRFIKDIFYSELQNDYDIVFYVPPYHLERKIIGKNDGDGFFTANTLHNMNVLLNMTREIRTMHQYLESKNVKSISAWGGSTGASSILIASSMNKFDHISLMIPVVSWTNLALKQPFLKEINMRLNKNGFGDSLLHKSYSLVSAENYKTLTRADRIFIQNSEYDQLIPTAIIDSFCYKNKILKHTTYKTGHGTILLSKKMFKDYAEFISTMKVK